MPEWWPTYTRVGPNEQVTSHWRDRNARKLATVRVKDGKGGFLTINADDFDESVHEVFEADVVTTAPRKVTVIE